MISSKKRGCSTIHRVHSYVFMNQFVCHMLTVAYKSQWSVLVPLVPSVWRRTTGRNSSKLILDTPRTASKRNRKFKKKLPNHQMRHCISHWRMPLISSLRIRTDEDAVEQQSACHENNFTLFLDVLFCRLSIFCIGFRWAVGFATCCFCLRPIYHLTQPWFELQASSIRPWPRLGLQVPV